MLAENHLSVEEKEKQNNWTEALSYPACFSVDELGFKPAKEILSVLEPVSRGNADPTALISTQPLLAAAPPGEVTQEAAAFQKPLLHYHKSTCPPCGLPVPEHRPQPVPQLKGSEYSGTGNKSGKSGSHQRAAAPADSCFHLLLACLWCQFSVLLLGLLEACASCLQGLCSSCCHACARCCSAVRDTPVEEFNCHAHCHSVLFESCCEPTECLEFCLECCEICHRG